MAAIAERSDVRKASQNPDVGIYGHNFLAHPCGVTFHWNTCDPVDSILSNAIDKVFRVKTSSSYWKLIVAGDRDVDCRAMLFCSTVRDVLESIHEMCSNGCGAFEFSGLMKAPGNPEVYIAMSASARERYNGTAVQRITDAFVTTEPPEENASPAFSDGMHWIIMHPHAGLLPNSYGLPRCVSVPAASTIGDVLSAVHDLTICSGPHAIADKVYFEGIRWIAPGVVEVLCGS